MQIVLIHPKMPDRFKYLAQALAQDPENKIIFITFDSTSNSPIPGVEFQYFPMPQFEATNQGSGLSKIGQAAFGALSTLKKSDITPDIFISEAGTGATLFVRDLFPTTPFLGYFTRYSDQPILTEAILSEDLPVGAVAAKEKSMLILQDLMACTKGICPTQNHRSTFPKLLRPKLSVIHPGIDTDYFSPESGSPTKPGNSEMPDKISCLKEELIVCVSGRPPFTASSPALFDILLQIHNQRPKARTIILNTNKSHENEHQDMGKDKRISIKHHPSPEHCRDLFRTASICVFPDPFPFLSNMLLYALSCGSLVVTPENLGSREFIKDGRNGILSDPTNHVDLVQKTIACLEYPSFMAPLREKARTNMLTNYDHQKTTAAQINLIQRIVHDFKGPNTRPRFG